MLHCNPSFNNPRLKIKRAKQHISDLNERILAFERSCYRLSIKTDAETGYDVLYAEITGTVPEDFSLIIGDALHNLKSALDLTINEVIFSALGAYDDFARFPARKTKDELVSAVKGGKISSASKDVSDLIVDVIRPYDGGNDSIWTLHRLNILDKHRLLIPVWQVNAIHDIKATDGRGEELQVRLWAITRVRTSRHSFQRHNVQITDYGRASVVLLFEKGFGVKDESVLRTLKNLTIAVENTVEGIAEVFLRENGLWH